MITNTKEADAFGLELAALVKTGQSTLAFTALDPILSGKVRFRLLDRIGAALAAQLETDFQGALERCRQFIILTGVWYAADTLAERVPVAALVADFNRAPTILKLWRTDPDRRVRKSAGVAVHLRTKRSHGEKRHLPEVEKPLTFLAPLFCEEDLDAVKGIGRALKTLGRNYPETAAPWLVRQAGRAHSVRALMLRKAGAHLSPTARDIVFPAAHR